MVVLRRMWNGVLWQDMYGILFFIFFSLFSLVLFPYDGVLQGLGVMDFGKAALRSRGEKARFYKTKRSPLRIVLASIAQSARALQGGTLVALASFAFGNERLLRASTSPASSSSSLFSCFFASEMSRASVSGSRQASYHRLPQRVAMYV